MPILDQKYLGKRSTPFFERDGKRIWSFRWDSVNSEYDALEYSDDYGDTWTEWYVFQAGDPIPYKTAGTCFRDTQGNFYYTVYDDVTPQYRLYRIDGITKAITLAITFKAKDKDTGIVADAESFPIPVTAHTWSFTEDNDGYIYIGQYGGGVANGNLYHVHYIWKSPPGGLDFQIPFGSQWIIDTYYDPARLDTRDGAGGDMWHVHAIHVNPHTNKLYINIGDLNPGHTFVSSDKLQTAPTVLSNSFGTGQFTGLTFTEEAVYFGDDHPSASNAVYYCNDDATLNQIYKQASPNDQIALYYIRAVGNNELYLCAYQEGWQDSSSLYARLIRLTKDDGVDSPWTAQILFEGQGSDLNIADATSPYAISHDGQGIIPKSSPYVFVQMIDYRVYNINNAIPGNILRIQRVEDSELPLTSIQTTIIIPTFLNRPLNYIVTNYSNIQLPIYSDTECTTLDATLGNLSTGQVNTIDRYIKNESGISITVRLYDSNEAQNVVSYSWDGVSYADPSAWKTIQPGVVQNFKVKVDLTTVNIAQSFSISKEIRG